MSNCLERELEK